MIKTFNALDMEPSDDLESFVQFFLQQKAPLFYGPAAGFSFTDGANGVCLFRHGDKQAEMFLLTPGFEVPDHIHPNVDSIEVAVWGMQFRHSGEIVLPFEMVEIGRGWGIRVQPGDWHGGTASSSGACFLSFQKWLNDVPPTSVGNDWTGPTMGPEHVKSVTTGGAAQQPPEEQPA
jgi:hypothetical protein